MYLDALRVPAQIFLHPQSHCNLRYTVLEVANEVLLPTSIPGLRDGKSLSTLLSITNFMSALIWTMFPCGCSHKNLKPQQFNHFHKDHSKIAQEGTWQSQRSTWKPQEQNKFKCLCVTFPVRNHRISSQVQRHNLGNVISTCTFL